HDDKEGQSTAQSRKVATTRLRDGEPSPGIRRDGLPRHDGPHRLRAQARGRLPEDTPRAVDAAPARTLPHRARQPRRHHDPLRPL
ncbi:hypothetical protein BN1708_018739, partial [Verticillium longisporum]